jgi:hypothetical protein
MIETEREREIGKAEADTKETSWDNLDIVCFGREAQHGVAASMFYCQDGENRLLRNVVTYLTNYTASHTIRQSSS